MKIYLAAAAVAAMTLAAAGVRAQDSTTVVHKDESGDVSSKKVVHHADGSKTVVKKHGDTTKKIHTTADGDKTIVKKTTE